MRYSASEKYEIIHRVENTNLPFRQSLRHLDIGKTAFYNWLKRYQENGIDGLEDKKPSMVSAWNRIPQAHRDALIEMALDKTELSPRGISVAYTDHHYFVSESTVYRILKAEDLITSPAYPDAGQ